MNYTHLTHMVAALVFLHVLGQMSNPNSRRNGILSQKMSARQIVGGRQYFVYAYKREIREGKPEEQTKDDGRFRQKVVGTNDAPSEHQNVRNQCTATYDHDRSTVCGDSRYVFVGERKTRLKWPTVSRGPHCSQHGSLAQRISTPSVVHVTSEAHAARLTGRSIQVLP